MKKIIFYSMICFAIFGSVYVSAASASKKYTYGGNAQGVFYSCFLSMTDLSAALNDQAAYTVRLYNSAGHSDDLEGATVGIRLYTDKKAAVAFHTVSKRAGLLVSKSGVRVGYADTTNGGLAFYENKSGTDLADHKNYTKWKATHAFTVKTS